MKKMIRFAVLLTLVLQPGFGAMPSIAAQDTQPTELVGTPPTSGGGSGMPGWPRPDKPIPHNEPGHPSGASSYTSQVEILNMEGLPETVSLSGLDAMAADGIDPLVGNYTLVSQDQVLRSWWLDQALNKETLAITPTVSTLSGGQQNLGDYPYNDVTAADLNGDGQFEQVQTWLGYEGRIYMSSEETAGMAGKITSAPAVVAHGVEPPEGYALQFNGTDQFVDVGDQINLANSSFTIAFWAKRDTINRSDYIIGQGVAETNKGLHIGFRTENKFTCAFWANDLDSLIYTDTGWHHWACTYDVGTGSRSIYRDGVMVAQDTASAYTGSGPLYIGKSTITSPMLGLVDQVGIWSTARTPEQIAQDVSSSMPDATDLVAYWPFDEGSGDTAADVSGNSHDGTLVNSPVWNPENAPQGELGEIHLLVRGYDDALWHCNYDTASGECLNWDNAAGGILLSGPAAVSLGTGQFDVYAIGIDDEHEPDYLVIWTNHWENGVWSGWVALDDPDELNPPQVWPTLDSLTSTPLLPAPAVVTRSAGQIDLFWLWSDNTLRWRHYNGSAWGDWQDLGGFLATAPGAVSLGADQMAVFAGGVDGALWQRTYNNGWGNWQRVPMEGMSAGVTIASPPAVVSPAANQMDVYVRGSDGQAWMTHYNGSSWGTWSAIGGELDSGPGAAVWSGASYLFAQKKDGLLQSSLSGSLLWGDLGGLPPCCAVHNTGLTGVLKEISIDRSYQDYSLDIEAGYFWGDGRDQIALAYFRDTNHVSIQVFENGEGFKLAEVEDADLDLPQDVDYFDMATGDFLDGDGIDEIALAWVVGGNYDLVVFRVTPTGLIQEQTGSAWDAPDTYFAGTFQLTSGDLDGDGQEEIGLISAWYGTGYFVVPACKTWKYYVRTNVYDLLEDENGVYSLKKYYVEDQWYDEAYRHGYDAEYVGLTISAGDVNGDGKDELVRTWPDRFDVSDDWICTVAHLRLVDRFVRKLQVVSLPANPNKNTNTWDDGDNPDGVIDSPSITDIDHRDWTPSYQDLLAVGDLNRDLDGEFVWQMSDELRTYQSDPDPQNPPDEPYQPYSTNLPLSAMIYPKLVTGAFSGESVRVGAPSYRVQNRVDTLVSVINMPPRHRDLVKDSNGDYQLIVTPDDTCWPTPTDPRCTHAKYATSNFDSAQQTLQSVHAYSISAGMESKACAGGGVPGVFSLKACVNTSIDYTHGGNFEKTTDTINSVNFQSKLIAADDDKLVFYGTPYAVWEYPVLSGTTSEADGFITVAFPLIKQTRFPGNDGGYLSGACDEEWYTPGHQLYNVWSYDPYGALSFEDYDTAYEPVYDAYPKSAWSFDQITYENFQSVLDSSTFKHAISAGRQVEVEAEAKIKVVDLEGSFKAYVNGSYENTSMQSDVFTTKDTTEYSYFLGPQPAGSEFDTRVVFYWAKDGYQVLNYQTEPGEGSSWAYYKDIADPAFILPWYGFPDPVTGQFPQSPPDAPPCGLDKQLLSPDLEVNPKYASVGETVVISATVRNFSNTPPGPFTVKFYQGDPSQGGVEIGQDTIENLARYSGPKTAQISWAASGAGRQKIFAVIDPGGSIPEVHDEGDWIDNNTAYTNIEIGSIAYTDRGVVEEQAYQGQSYSQSEDVAVSFYQPSANLEAVSKFELKDSESLISGVGNPFELVAYQGSDGDMWDDPIPDFDLAPEGGSPPAVLTIAYSEAAIGGHNESNLRLYRKAPNGWEEANLSCGLNTAGEAYAVQRFPEDNLIAVPVCKTGKFVLSDTKPITYLYLPMIRN